MDDVNESMSDVAAVADLVAIAPESTVSRTILRAEGVRLVLFAFDTGEELTEHTAAMPVLLQAFPLPDSAAEALTLANDTIYGLAGFVFTANVGRGLALAERINAGSVWVNDIHRSNHSAPFGGMKQSGIGREKGRYGVESYLEYKTVYLTYDEGLA